jgi:hypothetical protein
MGKSKHGSSTSIHFWRLSVGKFSSLPQMIWFPPVFASTINISWIFARILERINACRRYLQAMTIADISDPAGTSNPSRAGMTNEKFNQPLPPTSAWLSWRKFLQTCVATPAGRLLFPLREWTVPHHRCRHYPAHIHNPTTNEAFQHHTNGLYKKLDHSTDQSYYIVNEDNLPTADVTGYPCQGYNNGTLCHIMKNYIQQPPTSAHNLDGTFPDSCHPSKTGKATSCPPLTYPPTHRR